MKSKRFRTSSKPVSKQPNGSVMLAPRKAFEIEPISSKSLAMQESSAANFKKGIASDVIDLSAYIKEYSVQSNQLIRVSVSKNNITI